MNLLALVQEFCRRTGVVTPTYIIGNPDKQVSQLGGLMNELCEDLLTRKVYQQNSRECVFTSTAAEDQGDINTLCPYGYQGILQDTMFDRTQRLALTGGLDPAQWQVNKSLQNLGPYYMFRVRNNRLLFQPVLPANHVIAFEYASSYFVQDTVTTAPATTFKPYWTLDTDTFTLPDHICMSWLRWRWKQEKGLEYAEDFRKYELALEVKGNRDNAPRRAELAGGSNLVQPGIIVPQGNWMQP